MPNNIPELSVAELLMAIARSLVDLPEDVSLNQVSSETGTLLRLKVHSTDVGKVIGKQGRTARSIRTLLGAISVKYNHRYSLEIVEDVDSSAMDRN
ncbi:MAG: KH domain-containing protein [Acidobacteriaceae bacterium]